MELAEIIQPEPAPPLETSPAAGPVDLTVRCLSLTVQGREILSGLDFSVREGERVALLGANGAGKSTLLRCCLGTLHPTGGTVTLFDNDLSRLSRRKAATVRRQCGFVAQQHHLVPRLSVLSNVLHGLLGAHAGPRFWTQALAPASLRGRAMEALDQVGLADRAGQRVGRLSGGQSQRVAIARALVGGPRMILADEPAASLDPAAGDDVMALLARLARESGATIVFTSHNIDHALRFAGRVIALQHGRLRLDAPTDTLDRQRVRRVYG